MVFTLFTPDPDNLPELSTAVLQETMKEDSDHLHCQICGVGIPPGGLFYIGRTEIISGSDGILPDTEKSADAIIKEAIREITEVKSEQELMDGVYQEIRLIFCNRCRIHFRDRILDLIKY